MNNDFKYPPAAFRPQPFWSLNGDLKDSVLRQQIRDFAHMGFGGFFMHPRPGMQTPYLEEPWFDRVRTMVDEGRRLGLEAWLYDEDSYPSGFASGELTRQHPEWRSHALILVTEEQRASHPCILHDFGPCTEQAPGHPPLRILSVRHPGGSGWYDGECYVDTLNPEVIQAFIASTHEAYRLRLSKEFGHTIPGVFTDEPHHGPGHNGDAVEMMPWSPRFPEIFMEKFGYDLRDTIQSLFFELPGYEKVRFDFFRMVNNLFVTNFCQPMFDWCEDHGLELTGHFWEHCYPLVKGQASIMTAAKYLHRPGVDVLGKDMDKCAAGARQVGNCLMVKAVSSVAHQYGRRRVMSETWGGCGWDQTLADHRRSADWQMILGVNYFVAHLSHYSLKGYRKSDYPISFTRALPYWEKVKGLSDHLARVSYALSCGDSMADILVLLPSAHHWIHCHTTDPVDQDLEDLCRQLIWNQFEFDFGDETLMAEDGWVKEGRLGVGKTSYSTVLIPSTEDLHSSTLILLQELLQSGGRVLLLGAPPIRIDGFPSPEPISSLLPNAGHFHTRAELSSHLADTVKRPFRIQSSGRIMSTQRRDAHHLTVFLTNVESTSDDVAIQFAQGGTLLAANTLTGAWSPVDPLDSSGCNYAFSLASGESKLLRMDESIPPQPASSPAPPRGGKTSLEPTLLGRVRRDPNLLLLDHASWQIGSEPWSDEAQLQSIQHDLCERYSFDYQPMLHYRREYRRYGPDGPRSTGDQLRLKFTLAIDDNALQHPDILLACEDLNAWTLQVNGQDAPDRSDDFFLDDCFSQARIGSLLVAGDNSIEMTRDITEDLYLAPMYVRGDFGVALQAGVPRMTCESLLPITGNLSEHGYPFYAGRMTYQAAFTLDTDEENLTLRFQGFDGAVLDATLNGQLLGDAWDDKDVLPIGPLPAGTHHLDLTIYSTLKNALGPHYTNERAFDCLVVPAHYNHIHQGRKSLEACLSPFGLRGPITIERRLKA